MPENGNEHLRHFISAASLETTPVLGMLSWGMREKEGGGGGRGGDIGGCGG